MPAIAPEQRVIGCWGTKEPDGISRAPAIHDSKTALKLVGDLIVNAMAHSNDSYLLDKSLDEHVINVLPRQHKRALLAWAERNKMAWVIRCIHQATEDKVKDIERTANMALRRQKVSMKETRPNETFVKTMMGLL